MIRCEHPVVLLNPSIKKLTQTYDVIVSPIGTIHLADHHLPKLSLLYPKRCGVTPDTANNYAIVNESTGETKPLYIVVPCGRCVLCRKRKSNELAARCIAETNRWGSVPYFITFTYAPKFLPADGVVKADLQFFFKRLRSRLDYYEIEHKLRYFAVAEYGHKTGRAHYHVILWNFPDDKFSNIDRVITFLERCWSKFKIDPDTGKRIPKRDSNGNIVRRKSGYPIFETEQIGMIKVLPMNEGAPAYVTKYMRKEPYIPAGKNPTFQLSSRRGGGIGREWIEEQKDIFTGSLSCTSLEITDKVVSGKTFHCPITPYVKQVILPSASSKYSKKQYDLFKTFLNKISIFNDVTTRFCELYKTDLFDFGRENKRAYYEPFIDLDSRPLWREALKRVSFLGFSPERDKRNYFSWLRTINDFNEYTYLLLDEINDLALKVLDIPDYSAYFCDRDKFLNERGLYLQSISDPAEQIDVALLVETVLRNSHRNDHKDVF
nr:MAG TPA: Replication associated protein [Microviridae sp.]